MLGGMAAALGRRRPNFVFLMADDHAAYVMGADGNPRARTPHLDRLAREGTRFSAHYCNSPVCTPSRQSLLTGQMPHSAGVTLLSTPLREGQPTLARQFQKAGYTTAVFGKMHFNRPATPGLHGFHHVYTEDVLNRQWKAAVQPKPVSARVKTKPIPWKPFKDPARIWLNADHLPYPAAAGEMRAEYQIRQAGEFLEQHRNQPFALWVSFLEPHSPFDFPVEYRGRFTPASFAAPEIGPEDAARIPLVFRGLTESDAQGIAAAYHTSVEYLDHNIGRVLRKLRELGLEEDTMVVYLADHGYDLGQHGRFEKHCGYEPALRVPLLMRYPGRIRQGAVADFTEHVDVPATIVDLMGLEPLPVMHGRSLRPYLEGKRVEGRSHIFSEYLENEEAYVRDRRWKCIYCSGRRARQDGYATDSPTPGRYSLLYDMEADPGEFHDVSGQQPEMAASMRRMMLARFRATHPEAAREPQGSVEETLDWYLRPRA